MSPVTTDTIFWTQIASVIGFVVALFVLYRLLVDQKEATIQLQKEQISFLKDQLSDAKAQSPDVLAQSLTSRVAMLEAELKRLEQDKSVNGEEVQAKEKELAEARSKAETLTKQVLHARSLLKDFQCPCCGAPLAEKAYHSESVEYQDREIDIDHEYISFECGFELVDGQPRGQCRNTTPATVP